MLTQKKKRDITKVQASMLSIINSMMAYDVMVLMETLTFLLYVCISSIFWISVLNVNA